MKNKHPLKRIIKKGANIFRFMFLLALCISYCYINKRRENSYFYDPLVQPFTATTTVEPGAYDSEVSNWRGPWQGQTLGWKDKNGSAMVKQNSTEIVLKPDEKGIFSYEPSFLERISDILELKRISDILEKEKSKLFDVYLNKPSLIYTEQERPVLQVLGIPPELIECYTSFSTSTGSNNPISGIEPLATGTTSNNPVRANPAVASRSSLPLSPNAGSSEISVPVEEEGLKETGSALLTPEKQKKTKIRSLKGIVSNCCAPFSTDSKVIGDSEIYRGEINGSFRDGERDLVVFSETSSNASENSSQSDLEETEEVSSSQLAKSTRLERQNRLSRDRALGNQLQKKVNEFRNKVKFMIGKQPVQLRAGVEDGELASVSIISTNHAGNLRSMCKEARKVFGNAFSKNKHDVEHLVGKNGDFGVNPDEKRSTEYAIIIPKDLHRLMTNELKTTQATPRELNTILEIQTDRQLCYIDALEEALTSQKAKGIVYPFSNTVYTSVADRGFELVNQGERDHLEKEGLSEHHYFTLKNYEQSNKHIQHSLQTLGNLSQSNKGAPMQASLTDSEEWDKHATRVHFGLHCNHHLAGDFPKNSPAFENFEDRQELIEVNYKIFAKYMERNCGMSEGSLGLRSSWKEMEQQPEKINKTLKEIDFGKKSHRASISVFEQMRKKNPSLFPSEFIRAQNYAFEAGPSRECL